MKPIVHHIGKYSPHISVAQFMGYLKGKSSLMIFDLHANLKYKYGSRNFWCRRYYVDTVSFYILRRHDEILKMNGISKPFHVFNL